MTALMAFAAQSAPYLWFSYFRKRSQRHPSTLLLIGIAIGQLITAVIAVLMLLFKESIETFTLDIGQLCEQKLAAFVCGLDLFHSRLCFYDVQS